MNAYKLLACVSRSTSTTALCNFFMLTLLIKLIMKENYFGHLLKEFPEPLSSIRLTKCTKMWLLHSVVYWLTCMELRFLMTNHEVRWPSKIWQLKLLNSPSPLLSPVNKKPLKSRLMSINLKNQKNKRKKNLPLLIPLLSNQSLILTKRLMILWINSSLLLSQLERISLWSFRWKSSKRTTMITSMWTLFTRWQMFALLTIN